MLWILLTGIVAALTWYYLIKPLRYWSDRGVKQSKPWIIFGDSWSIFFRRMSFAEFVEWSYNMYPNTRYSGIYQFYMPTLMLRNIDLIKQIAVKDFDHFTDRRSVIDPDGDPLWGKMLFSLRGQKWREMRATLSGSFTSSKMKCMYPLIAETAENFVQYFSDKNEDIIEVEMKDMYTRYSNDVIATTAFGIKVDSMADPKNIFYVMGKKAANLNGIVKRIKFFGFFIAPKVFKFFKIGLFDKDVATFFRAIINETIKAREEQGIIRPDLINLLLNTRKCIKNEENEVIETGFAIAQESPTVDFAKSKQLKNLSNEDIISQCLVFFFAGFDTISTVICFGSYELAINKQVQDKLREEIKATYERFDEKISYEVLLKMKYLDMVVSEILRKWPPAINVDRVCTKPYIIEPITPDETPVTIKIGDIIWIPIHGIHRDPAFYLEPEKFDPERFSDENKDDIKPYTYIPFGMGPRHCVSSRFALLETKALLFNLLLHYEVVPTKKTQIPLKLSRGSLNYTAEGGFWFGLKSLKK